MNEKGNKESTNVDRDGAEISREFDFPRKSVFEMLVDPKKAVTWFGYPDGAEIFVFEFDPRPGGTIRIQGRYEGEENETVGTILEIVVPERFVFKTATAIGEGAAHQALQTMRFEELGPKRTRVTVTVRIVAVGSFPGGVEPLEEGYKGGWGQTLDRLQRRLG
ncbi:MAG: SRPBCC family protein [Thermoplasmata archaeon]